MNRATQELIAIIDAYRLKDYSTARADLELFVERTWCGDGMDATQDSKTAKLLQALGGVAQCDAQAAYETICALRDRLWPETVPSDVHFECKNKHRQSYPGACISCGNVTAACISMTIK